MSSQQLAFMFFFFFMFLMQQNMAIQYVVRTDQNPASAFGFSGKYLIASFPDLRQVSYTMLPDNVWRPLVIGNVSEPSGLAVDDAHHRVYVADPGDNKIYWYTLSIVNGYLVTDGVQHTALDGYKVYWMTLNSQGDLYFTGKLTVEPPQSVYDTVFRIDWANLVAENPDVPPIEVYTRSNSGNPNPGVYMPSGIAVDSFSIYWGNQDEGTTHGSIVKGPRRNLGNTGSSTRSSGGILTNLLENENSVLGLTSTPNLIFFLTPNGIYGTPKYRTGDSSASLISGPPDSDANTMWDPRSVAFDNNAAMYITDHLAGKVYTLPAVDTNPHPIQQYSIAPDVFGIALYDTSSGSGAVASMLSARVAALALLLSFARS